MRIFAAVKASGQIQKAVANMRKGVELDVRWIPAENLHITLVPPFEADETEIMTLTGKLNNVRFHKDSVIFKSVSFGPSKKEPRLIWLTAEASDELAVIGLTRPDWLCSRRTGRILICRYRKPV